ncbi:threonine/serine exporter family protein [Atopococcus tabaci]|uniref:threonine/serine exporter family protein n=1 Tax=Atopococcus tabaci TaxID=269774 RepID=UPI00240A3C7B|nr:threonine/serine exporter family protein [Atopococcus tabaci]
MNAFEKVDNFFNITFFAQIVASFVTGIIAMLFVQTGWGNNLDTIIVSALMGLVPGMAITNSFRDLMAGHLVAGISLLAQALLTAAAIGVGIFLSWRCFKTVLSIYELNERR